MGTVLVFTPGPREKHIDLPKATLLGRGRLPRPGATLFPFRSSSGLLGAGGPVLVGSRPAHITRVRGRSSGRGAVGLQSPKRPCLWGVPSERVCAVGSGETRPGSDALPERRVCLQ